MNKLLIFFPLLLSLSGVFAISCADKCYSLGYEEYSCTNTNYTGQYYCLSGDYRHFCHHSFTEVFGTTCGFRCWCHNKTACGYGATECNTYCGASGCSGDCGLEITTIDEPENAYQYETSTVSVNIHHTSGMGCLAYVECHIKDPSNANHYIEDDCEFVHSGSYSQLNPSITLTQVGSYKLLSCAVYEAEGDTVCSGNFEWKDEYDYFPYYIWNSSTPDCPSNTFGYCSYSQVGSYKCFANYRSRCDYTNGTYCWINLGSCSPLVCVGGNCVSITTTTTVFTTTKPTTTTTIKATTTTLPPLQELDEPFNTTDMPNELRFLNNLSAGLFNIGSSLAVGFFLLMFSLTFATIIILIGKRSLG